MHCESLYYCFIEFQKSYNTTSRAKKFKVLVHKLGLDLSMVKCINFMYRTICVVVFVERNVHALSIYIIYYAKCVLYCYSCFYCYRPIQDIPRMHSTSQYYSYREDFYPYCGSTNPRLTHCRRYYFHKYPMQDSAVNIR